MTHQETELVATLAAERPRLRDWLRRVFPRLHDEAEDILHDAVTETLHRLQAEEFRPQAGWYTYVRWLAKQRALDRLRSWERRVFLRLSLGSPAEDTEHATAWEGKRPTPVDPRPAPAHFLEDAERRGRQGLLLSEVLQEFCRWCESRAERWRIKEAYERSLRGEPPAQIATAMGLSPNEVYTLLNQARKWVVERIRQADVDRSGVSHVASPQSGVISMPDPLPELDSFAAVVRWVIEELGALYPSAERLAAYRANPHETAFHDIRYHVEEAGCPLCRTELESSCDEP